MVIFVIIAILIISINIAFALKTNDSEKLLINLCFLMGSIYVVNLQVFLNRFDRSNELHCNNMSESEMEIWKFSFKILGLAFIMTLIVLLLYVLGKMLLCL